jgi:hypothetical protein
MGGEDLCDGTEVVVGAVTGAEEFGFARGVHRRIEQYGVLAHQTPTRPVHFHQEGHEGLGDRVGRVHQQHIPAILALAHLEGQGRQERRRRCRNG